MSFIEDAMPDALYVASNDGSLFVGSFNDVVTVW